MKVVARKEGKVVGEKEIRTAGTPAQIRLTPDRSNLYADGRDLSFVTVEILDKDGNLCPNADNLVRFQITEAPFRWSGSRTISARLFTASASWCCKTREMPEVPA